MQGFVFSSSVYVKGVWVSTALFLQSIGDSGWEAMEVLNSCFEIFFNANKKRGKCIDFSPISFMVRQAGFEPAAYGFVDRTSEFPNLLKTL